MKVERVSEVYLPFITNLVQSFIQKAGHDNGNKKTTSLEVVFVYE
jgi:uncharacterized protein YheU (UPF0270 family)